jgi:predicted site-specific integrase-resolvase
MKESIEVAGRHYDSAEVIAERYGITYTTVWRWCRTGLLPSPIRLGGRTNYDREMVEARILERKGQ